MGMTGLTRWWWAPGLKVNDSAIDSFQRGGAFMKFLVHEGADTTGPLGWYESGVDIVPGNKIAIPTGKTFTVDYRAVNEIVEAGGAISPGEPLKQVRLFCTPSNVSPDTPGVIQLTVAARQTAQP
jgi:hypothetical protein